ncbi:MAG: hypothetical protein ACOVLE_00860 [Pirellula staleyi]
MKHLTRITHNGRRYQFLGWADDGTARCIDLLTDTEVWLHGVTDSISSQRAQEKSKADESRLNRRKDSERIQREAFELFRTNDALRAYADAELLAKRKQS